MDDFIRNFLIKMKLNKTLKTFQVHAHHKQLSTAECESASTRQSCEQMRLLQAEWYELTQKGILSEEDVGVVPDIYLRNQQMDDNVKCVQHAVFAACIGLRRAVWQILERGARESS